MAFVVKSGKALLNFLHIFRKARPFLSKKRHLSIKQLPLRIFLIAKLESPLDLLIIVFFSGMHPDDNVKMRSHGTETQNFGEVNRTQAFDMITKYSFICLFA